MGFFKKIFKPVAKVLDKVIPNEIKPALPYLAALAPVFAPAGMQGLIGSTMGRRALTSGLLNIGAQLSQEGSEGDINLLSAGLGALTGAMTAPGTAPTTIRGDLTTTVPDFSAAGVAEGPALKTVRLPGFGAERVVSAGSPSSAQFFKGLSEGAQGQTGIMASGKRFLGDTLAKGSEMFAEGAAEGLFSKAGAKAATLPIATATGDVMQAQARQLEKEEARQAALAEAEALADSGARAAAIRNAMNAYGFFTDEEIEETISSAGYKKGGRVGFDKGGAYMDVPYSLFVKAERAVENEEINPRTGDPYDNVDQYIEAYLKGYKEEDFKYKTGGRVGFRFGGIDEAIDKVEDESIKESVKMMADMPDMDLMDLIEEFEIIFKRKPMSIEELKRFYRETYEMESPVKLQEKIKEKVTVEAKDGGRIGLREGGGLLQQLTETVQTTQNAPMFLGRPAFAPTLQQPIFPRLNQLEQGVNMAENKLSNIRGRLGNEQRQLSGLLGIQPFGIQPAFQPLNGLLRAQDQLQLASGPARGMKEGGMMDLGGKEMDLRGGGFVPIGKKERADDVPARLSKNEFVMTADAVRGAGGGDINKGAKRMYETMNNLEARA